MIHGIFGTYDNTIYEQYPEKNTGLDSVLDLSKTIIGNAIYNNRILLSYDLTSISQSVAAGQITSPKYYLNLYTVEAQEVPTEYTIEVYPVSQSWVSGIGKYVNKPETSEGSSWTNRSNTTVSSVEWLTSSFAAGSTGSTTFVSGGGTWYTGYSCTQSYNYSSTDIRIEVTSIVNDWLNGTIPNNGFLIKKSHNDETNNSAFSILKYFSSDSHTIYQPKLEIVWQDATFTTGSLTQPNTSKQILVYPKNLKPSYKETSKVRIDVGVREKYPTITFATQSNYLTNNFLPSSSFFYSLQHADTQETVIPFDSTYTKVSCDSNGNFIKLWLDGLHPERYYKLMFKVERDGTEEYYDNNYIFKVVK